MREAVGVAGKATRQQVTVPQLANRILVIDDDPDVLSEVTQYLRRRGQAVLEATSFREAQRTYENNANSIGLVITDVRMSDGNGVDLARWVIDRSKGECPCLLVTGHLQWDDLGADLEAASVRIVNKPFALSALYALVISMLARADEGQSSEA
jgi:DNA-binding response OmpR family regulator